MMSVIKCFYELTYKSPHSAKRQKFDCQSGLLKTMISEKHYYTAVSL